MVPSNPEPAEPDREPFEEGIPTRGTFKREVWNVVSTYGRGGIRTHEIAKRLNKPAANVRSALEQLEKNGLVIRIQRGTWDLC